jgi:hypothetical protein
MMDFLRDFNYPFSTPRKKKSAFRKQETEWIQNEGVETRQLVSPARRENWRRQNPAVRFLE